jgi:hypothetical protein
VSRGWYQKQAHGYYGHHGECIGDFHNCLALGIAVDAIFFPMNEEI